MIDIALYGGEPVRGTRLSYGRQYIDEEDIQAVAEVLKSDFLTCGPKVSELEAVLCQLTGAAHCTVMTKDDALVQM